MSQDQPDIVEKLMLIGPEKAGKTKLLDRLCTDRYSEQYQTTIGVDFKIKTYESAGKKIKYHIWDTAGQEKFKEIIKSYFLGAHQAWLIYNPYDQNAIEFIKTHLNSLKEHDEQYEITLIATHDDIIDKQKLITPDDVNKIVNTFKSEHPAFNSEIKNFSVSNKTGAGFDALKAHMNEVTLKRESRQSNKKHPTTSNVPLSDEKKEKARNIIKKLEVLATAKPSDAKTAIVHMLNAALESNNPREYFKAETQKAFIAHLKTLDATDEPSQRNSRANFRSTVLGLFPIIGWAALIYNYCTRGSPGLFFTEGGAKQLAQLAQHEIKTMKR